VGGIRIVKAGPERIPDLEPLWKALHAHHRSVDPRIPGVPMRGVDDTWPRRRAEYEEWLAEPDAFVLIAEDGDRPVGYALVHPKPADDGWETGGRFAELETLCLLPEARGEGLGKRMMDAVYAELRGLGIRALEIGVLATNEGAARFYEREGFRPWIVHYLGTVPEEGEGPPRSPPTRSARAE